MTRPLLVLAVAASLLPGRAPADAWSSPCAHRVALDPAELTLGEGGRARLRIDLADDGLPVVAASAGEVKDVARIAPRRFEALFVPPRQSVPQVAIFTVTTPGGCGWAVLRMSGQGDAVVHSTPGAQIKVRIGAREFGPVRADARGRALLPVVVPPGVRFAYHGEKPIDLRIPPTHHAQVVLARSSVPADQEADVDVRVFATDAEGRPWRGEAVSLRPSAGRLEPLRAVEPGVFVARWTVVPGPSGEETIRARLPGDELDAAARLLRVPGAPARIDLDPERRELPPGHGPQLAVRVSVADAAGNPAPADVVLSSSPGTPVLAAQGPAGQRRYVVYLPADFAGTDRIVLTAKAGGAAATAVVTLSPGPAARVQLDPPRTVRGDGREGRAIRVAVVDRRGVVVPALAPKITAARGAVGAPSPEGGGWYAASYRPPLLEADADEEISASALGLRATARFGVTARRATLDVAPRAGVLVSGGGAAPFAAVAVTASVRPLPASVGVGVDVSWTRRQQRDDHVASASTFTLDGRAEYLSLLVGGAWRHPTGPTSALWVSAGAGAARASSSVLVTGAPRYAEAAWVPAAGAAVGWGLRLGPGSPFAEVGLRWHGDPRLSGLAGSYVPLTFALGYRLDAF